MLFVLQAEVDTRAVTTADLIVMAIVVVAAFLVSRVFGETIEQAELRRRQRIAATAAGLSRVLIAIVWIIAGLIVLERAEIDPVFAISGAGFLGVAIAIGGQHSVNDFVTGLHILLEDRFGEGDKLRVSFNDEELVLTVAHLGAFATRLQDGAATFYIPNRELSTVTNLSQRGAITEFDFEPTADIPAPNSASSRRGSGAGAL